MNSFIIKSKHPNLLEEDIIEIGQWYWVKTDPDDHTEPNDKWFGCVVQTGSNYVKIKGIDGQIRIHLDEFWEKCTKEPNPQDWIRKQQFKYQQLITNLVNQIQKITTKLSITTDHQLTSRNETQALATLTHTNNLKNYEKALVIAKEKTLPKLFKEIKQANENLSKWMCASLIPLQAKTESMKDVIGVIEDRIFNVELYAGLTEKVVQITKGNEAALDDKIHLMQRRHYMDEECLINYQHGGMEFRDLKQFDYWIAQPENRNRILPFSRCIVAFKIRRTNKQYNGNDLSKFIKFLFDQEFNESTFLYLRNGDNLYRMETALEFDEKLFPDLDRQALNSKIWAKISVDKVQHLITDDEYQGILEKEAKNKHNLATCSESDRWKYDDWVESINYHPFNSHNIHYDDISKYISNQIKKHNRIVLIIQGLLDRSPIFNPHPSWKIWDTNGFQLALKLIYDDSRALVNGQMPDFEAYCKKLNRSLTVGSLTVGQQIIWELEEGEKETQRQALRGHYHTIHRYTPYGNPGPGNLARIQRFLPKKGLATYIWNRERLNYQWSKPKTIKTSFTTEIKEILNIDSYTPGDFLQFFQDPRTRSEYLKWAPLLLEAEEYYAGNRSID